jgi:hypothetical protein
MCGVKLQKFVAGVAAFVQMFMAKRKRSPQMLHSCTLVIQFCAFKIKVDQNILRIYWSSKSVGKVLIYSKIARENCKNKSHFYNEIVQ